MSSTAWKDWVRRWKHSDLPHLRAGWLRLRCERAAIFLEFALVFPILLMFTLFLIDLCLYWDGVTMANHAAFTVARIARVRYDYQEEEFDVPKSLLGDIEGATTQQWCLVHGEPCTTWFPWWGEQTTTTLTEAEQRLAPIAALFMAGVTHEVGDAGALDFLNDFIDSDWLDFEEEPLLPQDWGSWVDAGLDLLSDPSAFLQAAMQRVAQKLVQMLVQELAEPVLDAAFDRLMGSEYGDQIAHILEFGRRYAIARRKFDEGDATLKLEVLDLTVDGAGSGDRIKFSHPSSKADDPYEKTKVVRVRINYPRKVLWRPFGRDGSDDPGTITLRGRWTALIEPEKLVPHPDYD